MAPIDSYDARLQGDPAEGEGEWVLTLSRQSDAPSCSPASSCWTE